MPEHPDDLLHASTPPDVDLERVWAGVAAEVWGGSTGAIERLAGRLLGSPGLARALVTTPSLVLSWILANAVVLAVGVAVTRGTGLPGVALLAPALAGAGIAYAYGPGVDPAFELSQTMPVSDRMILLVRAFAVFGVNALLGITASLLIGQASGITFGWLIPMTTVSALGLAVATVARSANAGVMAAMTGWAMVVLASAAGTRNLAVAVTNGEFMPVYLLGTVILGAVALYASGSRRYEGWRWR
ncbi:MAG TPA: hypothetical protein VFS96_01855 [Nitrolancea sp.]|nr:hypothetical protein [Nitrolancea sp.]